jgi:hypothetical protein
MALQLLNKSLFLQDFAEFRRVLPLISAQSAQNPRTLFRFVLVGNALLELRGT